MFHGVMVALEFLVLSVIVRIGVEQQAVQVQALESLHFFWGSRNLVGIAIQLSDSEEEEFFVGYPMLISPEKFDFGIERFGCGI